MLRRSAGMPRGAKPGRGLRVASRVVQENQVGSGGENRLEVGADPVAEVGHRFRGRRIVAPGRPTDDRVTGADGEEELGCGGDQRCDSARRRRHGHGIARIIDQTKRARRRQPALGRTPPRRAATEAVGEISFERPTSCK